MDDLEFFSRVEPLFLVQYLMRPTPIQTLAFDTPDQEEKRCRLLNFSMLDVASVLSTKGGHSATRHQLNVVVVAGEQSGPSGPMRLAPSGSNKSLIEELRHRPKSYIVTFDDQFIAKIARDKEEVRGLRDKTGLGCALI